MPDIILENDLFRLTVGEDAVLRSLVLRESGEECLAAEEEMALFSVTQERPFNNEVKLAHPNKRTTWQACALRREGRFLHVSFETVPVKAVVGIDEYGTGKSMWKTKPATMIRKVALVQALREAYPGEFAGLYDAAEMGDRGTPIIEIAPQDVEPVRVGDEEDAADEGREE